MIHDSSISLHLCSPGPGQQSPPLCLHHEKSCKSPHPNCLNSPLFCHNSPKSLIWTVNLLINNCPTCVLMTDWLSCISSNCKHTEFGFASAVEPHRVCYEERRTCLQLQPGCSLLRDRNGRHDIFRQGNLHAVLNTPSRSGLQSSVGTSIWSKIYFFYLLFSVSKVNPKRRSSAEEVFDMCTTERCSSFGDYWRILKKWKCQRPHLNNFQMSTHNTNVNFFL